MSYLLIGHNGQLGRSLLNILSKKAIPSIYNTKDLSEENLKRISNEICKTKYSAILNLAAWTDVEGAEINKELAYLTNVGLPKYLALAAKNLDIPFYHFSTDYVFSGNANQPWSVQDIKNPQNYYGKTKSEGEDIVQQYYSEGTRIIRTSWLYSEYKNNFAKKIIRKALRDYSSVSVVSDQIGQPTYAGDLASLIKECLENNVAPGVYHASNTEETSWYGFARKIFQLIGENPDRIISIRSYEYETLAIRPQYSVLKQTCWDKLGIKSMAPWSKSLSSNIHKIMMSVLAEEKKL